MIKLINWITSKLKKYSWYNENDLNDGYHTFDELYEFRKLYNAALFNEWGRETPVTFTQEYSDGSTISSIYNPVTDKYPVKYQVHKSWKHNDGEWCFGEEGKWFIVVAMLPTGQITNHYKAKDWDLFQVPTVDKAKFEFDNHTGKDVLGRLTQVIESDFISSNYIIGADEHGNNSEDDELKLISKTGRL